MILMIAPAPNMTFGAMPSGATYVSDQFSLLKIGNNSGADQSALINAGCCTLTPFGGACSALIDNVADLYAADAALGAVLPLVVGFPRYAAVGIFNDGANNGTWAKTGPGAGQGNWTQIAPITPITAVTFTEAAAAAAAASATGAATSAATAVAAAAQVGVEAQQVSDDAAAVTLAHSDITTKAGTVAAALQTVVADTAQVAADTTATHADRVQADASAVQATGAAMAVAEGLFFPSFAAANAAIATIPAGKTVQVAPDETRGGHRCFYTVQNGALAFAFDASPAAMTKQERADLFNLMIADGLFANFQGV